MSDHNISGGDQPEELDRFTEGRVAERVRAALADHAERVEPASNSYLKLIGRLEEVGPAAPKRSKGSNYRVLVAAAAIVVLAGAGAFVVSQARTGDVTAIGDGSGQTVPGPTPTTTIAPVEQSTTTVAPVGTTTPPPPEVAAAVVDQVLVPPVESPVDAAAAFVHLLGLPGSGRFTVEGNTVDVMPPGNFGADQPPLAIIEATPVDQGFGISTAVSDTMLINEVFVDDGELVVRGEGIAFEAAVEVRVIGTDGMPLALGYATAGCCEDLVPFEARLPMISGLGNAFVVAHGDNAGSGVWPAFAAVPIEFQGPADTAEYTVFRIRPDDSDEGLNVRDQPGTDEGRVLATLPPGETGISRLPEMPALVGDSFWWRIQTRSGVEGWVHSSFLTAAGPTTGESDLLDRARVAIYNINAAEYEGLGVVPLSRRVPVALGWLGDPRIVSGPEIADYAFWADARRWPVPEATYGEPEKLISLRSLLDLPETLDSDPELVAGAATVYGFEQEMVESYFVGAQAVTVIGPESGAEPRRTAMFFFEATPVGPQLVGVVASIFVP
ncbi:MAG: SH3 domain-containing protein [Acidimicrobiales bacterium]|nr:SH3 domain-containing protein [Acidimicrobiales bacterium]